MWNEKVKAAFNDNPLGAATRASIIGFFAAKTYESISAGRAHRAAAKRLKAGAIPVKIRTIH